MQEQHKPVLLDEVLEALMKNDEGVYIDCTFGRGGHTRAMLAQLGTASRVIGIDRDPDAIRAAQALAQKDNRFSIVHGAFSILQDVAEQHGVLGQVDGVLFDLGVSSPQLDEAQRGFSFMREGPLDMRMNPQAGQSASEWLAIAGIDEMADIFKRYGEERYAKRIARAIEAARVESPITTTTQLAAIVKDASPTKKYRPGVRVIHPATQVFQAIRIFINDELGEVERTLEQALTVLKPGGRMAVISFHSLEDRIVKRFMKKAAQGDDYPIDMPVTVDMLNPEVKLIGGVKKAKQVELAQNPRSRSAVLRVAEKLPEKAA